MGGAAIVERHPGSIDGVTNTYFENIDDDDNDEKQMIRVCICYCVVLNLQPRHYLQYALHVEESCNTNILHKYEN